MDAVEKNNQTQNVERLAETKRNQPASNKFISTQPTPQYNSKVTRWK